MERWTLSAYSTDGGIHLKFHFRKGKPLVAPPANSLEAYGLFSRIEALQNLRSIDCVRIPARKHRKNAAFDLWRTGSGSPIVVHSGCQLAEALRGLKERSLDSIGGGGDALSGEPARGAVSRSDIWD